MYSTIFALPVSPTSSASERLFFSMNAALQHHLEQRAAASGMDTRPAALQWCVAALLSCGIFNLYNTVFLREQATSAESRWWTVSARSHTSAVGQSIPRVCLSHAVIATHYLSGVKHHAISIGKPLSECPPACRWACLGGADLRDVRPGRRHASEEAS